MTRKIHYFIFVLFISFFLFQCVYLASTYSLTNDEGSHLVTGWFHLKHRHCCLGTGNSPLTAYFALPIFLSEKDRSLDIRFGDNGHRAGNLLLFGSKDPQRMLFLSRCTTIFSGIVLLLATFFLSKRLFGPLAGFVSLGVLSLDPNIIAHFSLISTDALLSTFIILFLISFDKLMHSQKIQHAVLTGILLGLTILAKFTGIILILATIVLLIIYRNEVKERPINQFIKFTIYIYLTAFIIIWIGYGFHFNIHFPFFHFPGLIKGISEVKAYATNEAVMVSFFNGEINRYSPFYFLEAIALKTPIPLLCLWFISFCTMFCSPKKRISQWAPAVIAVIFLGAAINSKLNIGLRHILHIYPLMAVFCGSIVLLFQSKQNFFRSIKFFIIALWSLLVIESIAIFPFSLSYFNTIAGGPIGGMRYLGDSNLDWGQDLGTLKKVMDRLEIEEVILAYMGNTDPSFYGIQYQYLPLMFVGSNQNDRVVSAKREIIAISTNNLQGFLIHVSYKWLLARTPFARAGYSIYIYDITGDADAHKHLANIYFSTGLDGLAKKELIKVSQLM